MVVAVTTDKFVLGILRDYLSDMDIQTILRRMSEIEGNKSFKDTIKLIEKEQVRNPKL